MAEWTQDNLQPLIDKYNEYLVSVGKSYAIILNGQAPTIRGFLSQGAIVLATDVWLKLREFAEWVVNEYDVTDNQMGVALGVSSALGLVPSFASAPSAQTLKTQGLALSGLSAPTNGIGYVGVVGSAPVFVCYAGFFSSPNGYLTYISKQNFSAYTVKADSGGNLATNTYMSLSAGTVSSSSGVSGFSTTPSGGYSLGFPLSTISTVPAGILRFGSLQEAYDYYLSGDGASLSFAGVTADTTMVSIPVALPEGTSWGGLAVEGIGDVATPQAVEDAIAEAVTAREQPVVQPVTITLAPDTEINPDNGDTDPPPVVITPFPPADPSAVELGQEILESFEAHFPFSVPWDLYKIFSRLDAEPVAPSWTLALPEVGGLEPVSIVIDVAETPFHALAPTFRAFVGILICLGLLIAATKWIKR